MRKPKLKQKQTLDNCRKTKYNYENKTNKIKHTRNIETQQNIRQTKKT